MSDVTRILNAVEQGDQKATNELLPLVYEELRCYSSRHPGLLRTIIRRFWKRRRGNYESSPTIVA